MKNFDRQIEALMEKLSPQDMKFAMSTASSNLDSPLLKRVAEKLKIEFTKNDFIPFKDRTDLKPLGPDCESYLELLKYVKLDKMAYAGTFSGKGRAHPFSTLNTKYNDQRLHRHMDNPAVLEFTRVFLYSIEKLFGHYHLDPRTDRAFAATMLTANQTAIKGYVDCIQLAQEAAKDAGISIPPNRLISIFHQMVREAYMLIVEKPELAGRTIDVPTWSKTLKPIFGFDIKPFINENKKEKQ